VVGVGPVLSRRICLAAGYFTEYARNWGGILR